MRITFVTRTFGNVERNSHCDVLHITAIRVVRLFLDCNGDFAIKAYYRLNVELHQSCAYIRNGSIQQKMFIVCKLYKYKSPTFPAVSDCSRPLAPLIPQQNAILCVVSFLANYLLLCCAVVVNHNCSSYSIV